MPFLKDLLLLRRHEPPDEPGLTMRMLICRQLGELHGLRVDQLEQDAQVEIEVIAVIPNA